MHFLDNILPDSIFGHRMPWAHEDATKQPETPANVEQGLETKPQDGTEQYVSVEDQEPITIEHSGEPTAPIDPAQSIEDGLSKLKLEQFSRIEQKAAELHGKAKALHTKIQGIDELLNLIQTWSTEHPNEPIDCQNPDIKRAAEALRHQGIRVPLPENKLDASQIGNVFTVLGNQRALLADEMKEASSEFQQCTVERNTLLQHLMSIVTGLSRLKNKIGQNLSSSHR